MNLKCDPLMTRSHFGANEKNEHRMDAPPKFYPGLRSSILQICTLCLFVIGLTFRLWFTNSDMVLWCLFYLRRIGLEHPMIMNRMSNSSGTSVYFAIYESLNPYQMLNDTPHGVTLKYLWYQIQILRIEVTLVPNFQPTTWTIVFHAWGNQSYDLKL